MDTIVLQDIHYFCTKLSANFNMYIKKVNDIPGVYNYKGEVITETNGIIMLYIIVQKNTIILKITKQNVTEECIYQRTYDITKDKKALSKDTHLYTRLKGEII